jgi:hypothetical protein
MTDKYMKKCSISLSQKGNANENNRDSVSPQSEWKTNNNRCWQGFRRKRKSYTLIIGI